MDEPWASRCSFRGGGGVEAGRALGFIVPGSGLERLAPGMLLVQEGAAAASQAAQP